MEDQVKKTYAKLTKILRGETSGVPAFPEYANDPKYADLYEKLRQRLDMIATGFQKSSDVPGGTENSDYNLLKFLFWPEHAEVALEIPIDKFADAEEITARLKRDDVKVVAGHLHKMAENGSIFHKKENGKDYYRLLGYTPGLLEFQASRLTTENIQVFGQYLGEAVMPAVFDMKVPSWRYLPVNQAVTVDNKILAYENVTEIIKSKKRIAVAPCMCRSLKPDACKVTDKPYDCCLQYDEWADLYVNDLKMSRYITQEEALALVKHNQENNIVMMAAGSLESEIMCSCCECCCDLLKAYKAFKGQSSEMVTNYYVDIDKDKCIECGKCAEVCFTREGIIMNENGKWEYHMDKCVGCGVCVNNCPNKALVLKRKPEDKQFIPPKTMFDTFAIQASGRVGKK
ncbi:Ion-translocating oxidoreductase complex subunit B [Sporomusa silvacetica DSM 10669]|uniref:Ion-translocating oxidoreductase complex subunit B n=1 Tax=Sporomusa silvacetica DSM 10669 TaxID=1123289 RepID=A0ABZ3ILB4_9FIRM|nr:4Fe-4S binding protein [Sporomusa silvacetica]OZC13437.1 electron transport complex subunit RsxB [Sporomusa silvacetica DSM 10669]